MSLSLYRKYRPQKFSELVNQNHIKVTLQNEIETGKITHAYLFTGPRGIGKTTTARILAKALNCEKRKNNQSEPCGKCEACQEITEVRSLDLVEIDAASHTGVDNVRENIINNARVAPSRWPYKVFIIDEVHMLSISAFNALLKTLEEPPEHAIFILATTEVHKLPETIISRCQRFDFKRIDTDDLIKHLNWICKQEKVKVDPKVLESIAYQSAGYIRDAISLLGQILALGGKSITLDLAQLVIPRSDLDLIFKFFTHLVKKNSAQGIALVNNLVEEGVDLTQFTRELIEFLRKLLLIKINGKLDEFSILELSQEVETEIISKIKEISLANIQKMIMVFLEKQRDLKNAEIIQLPLELAVVELTISQAESEKEINETPRAPSKTLSRPEISKKKIEPVKKAVKSPGTKMSLEEIIKLWPQVLEKLKDYNHSLSLTLKMANLQKIEGDRLILGFSYKFHQEVINGVKNKGIVEDVLKEVYGQDLKIETTISEVSPKTQDKGPEKNDLEELAKSFGGRVIK